MTRRVFAYIIAAAKASLRKGDGMTHDDVAENLEMDPVEFEGALQPDRDALSLSERSNMDEVPSEPNEGGDNAQDAILAADSSPIVVASTRAQRNTGTIVVMVCVIALLALTVLGSMLNVGDHLYAAHPALGWVFYGLLAALVVVGIVVPVVKVAKRPIFSLYQLRDEKGRAKQRWCRMLADNLINNTKVTDEEAAEIEACLKQGDKADDLLIEYFNKHCIPAIDAETKRAASTAFFISAVSRSPLISTVTMLSLCLDLVRAIVETCGFRPTNLGLAKLYTRIMLSALVIGGIEDSDLSDLLGQLMGGGAGARAGGIVIGATAEGLVSAFLVFRVGVLTKKWLTAEDGPISMRAARRTSYREALELMRASDFMQTVTDTVKQTTGTVAANVASAVKEKTDTVANTVTDSVSQAARSTMQTARSKMHAAKEALRRH